MVVQFTKTENVDLGIGLGCGRIHGRCSVLNRNRHISFGFDEFGTEVSICTVPVWYGERAEYSQK